MSDQPNELELSVGSIFTVTPAEDLTTFEEEKAWLTDIQDLLAEEGITVDLLSRPGAEIWEGGIETFASVYQLRLLAARLEHGADITSVVAPDFDLDDDPDPLLAEIWEGKKETKYPHLLNHQMEGGYYLPVEFPEPIWLEFEPSEEAEDAEPEDGVVSFGSAVNLQRELNALDEVLRGASVSAKLPAFQALKALRDAAGQSVSSDLPIVIW